MLALRILEIGMVVVRRVAVDAERLAAGGGLFVADGEEYRVGHVTFFIRTEARCGTAHVQYRSDRARTGV